METMIVNIKNKKEKEVLTAFLSSLRFSFHTESEEETALVQLYDNAKAKKERPVPFDAAKLKS